MAVVGDYAAQGVISTMIHNAFPDDLIVGEEDATDLRLDSGADLRRRIVELANEAVVGPLGVGDVKEWNWSWPGAEPGGTDGCHRQRKLPRRTDRTCVSLVFQLISYLITNNRNVDHRSHRWNQRIPSRGAVRRLSSLIVNAQVQVGVIGCPNLPFDADTKGSIFVTVRGQGAERLNIEGSNPTPISMPISMPTLTPSELNFLESVEAAHASHSTNDKISSILGITRSPIRMDSQAKYGCLARGDGGVCKCMPTGSGYKEKIWVCVLRSRRII